MAKLFGFDAKSIQTWIAQGNRLVDLATGSELIERLCGVDLDNALVACKIDISNNSEIEIFSRAGGHFRLEIKDTDKADKFQKIWPMLVNSLAPMLPFAFAFTDAGEEAEKTLHTKIIAQQNLPVSQIPLAPPIALRAQRTGRAACVFDENVNKLDSITGGAEAIGVSAARRRALREIIGAGEGQLEKKYELIKSAKIIWPDKDIKSFIFNADAMTDARETNVLAYIYADGSGLGQLFMGLANARDKITSEQGRKKINNAIKNFSAGLDEVTQKAARAALWGANPHLVKQKNKISNDIEDVISARPIVLGGDDLSIILPAKDALEFAKIYLENFEANAKEIYDNLKDELDGEEIQILKDLKKLTCGCSIAFVPSHYPAHKALNLAETMCSWAKKQVKRKASCIAFHRITTSEPEEYEIIFENELDIADRILTAGPYLLNDELSGFATIKQFTDLEEQASLLPHGTIRDLLSFAYMSKNKADRRLKRAINIAHGNQNKANKIAMEKFLQLLADMGAEEDESIWLSGNRTPIGDIHTIASVERRITDTNQSLDGVDGVAK